MNVDGRVTDAQVEQAIHRGVDFLIAQFQDGQIPRRQDTTELEAKGLNALAVYALLSASQAVRDERLGAKGEFLTKAIDQLKASSLDPGAAISAAGNLRAEPAAPRPWRSTTARRTATSSRKTCSG